MGRNADPLFPLCTAGKFARQLVTALDRSGHHRATKFLSDKFVVRATRRRYRARIRVKGGKVVKVTRKAHYERACAELTLTAGRPNYRERAMLATFKKTGETLPLRTIITDPRA